MQASFWDCLSFAPPFLEMGWEHILDPRGYDHMLFVVVLCCIYLPKEWKRVAWLVTAFTLGHSLTLFLAVKGWVLLSPNLVETLIPITILLTALHNLWGTFGAPPLPHRQRQYALAAVFGLIHGLGFSNYIKAILLEGQCLAGPLAFFNIGLELGQLLVVGLVMALGWLFLQRLGLKQQSWIQLISGGIALVSLWLLLG